MKTYFDGMVDEEKDADEIEFCASWTEKNGDRMFMRSDGSICKIDDKET